MPTLLHPPRSRMVAAVAALLALCAGVAGAATVYKWVDEQGVVHLSSEKPPAGVKYERMTVASSPSRSTSKSSGGKSGSSKTPAASPAQVAERSEVLSGLKNRECVIALEALDRLTSGTVPTSAAEIRRLQQTVDLNCSPDPARRRQQEEMAAKLRVANGADCVQARNLLGDMMAPGARFPKEQVRAQQQFVDQYCVPPVR